MPETLRLEFACTDTERKHAQSLHLQRQVGGGSKVLTMVVLLLALAAMLATFYVRIQREVSAAFRPYAYAAAFGVAFLAWLWIRRSRSAAAVVIRVDISDDGLSVRAQGGEVRTPWSAFSRLLESPEVFVLVDRPGTTLLTIPRRAFPGENWQEWFHTLATNRLSLADRPPADSPAAPPPDASPSVRLSLQLGYRDFLDCTVASWLTRGFLAGIATLMIGVSLYAAANPPPNAAFSATQMFFMFVLPSLLFMMAFVVLLRSAHTWFQSRSAVPQELSISPDSIAFSGPDGSGTLPWSTYDRFKETRGSFLLWNSGTPAWMILPKRAFGSGDDVNWCRDTLSGHLQQSPWFCR